jgi:ubiquinone/menaquinone biosynthesis C-methylase UbiE
MDIERAYNSWADQYDTNVNKTRDMEGLALRECLAKISFRNCLEIGCGTGKNTVWLLDKAEQITAVDLSIEMLSKAKRKLTPSKVNFIQADVNEPWSFTDQLFDLITFSLVLEHIDDLESVFKRASEKIAPGGYVYLGELHPFRQYMGAEARFETERGEQVVTCFTHNFSDFTNAALKYGFAVLEVNEYFDDDDSGKIPRILTIIFRDQRT